MSIKYSFHESITCVCDECVCVCDECVCVCNENVVKRAPNENLLQSKAESIDLLRVG